MAAIKATTESRASPLLHKQHRNRLYATNQPRGRGVGAVTAGYGTPWVSGFRVSWPASPLSQGQPTSMTNEEDSLQ